MNQNMIPLIDCYYSRGMLGGFLQRNVKYKKAISKVKGKAYMINKKLHNIYLKKKYLKGIIDYADIKSINDTYKSTPIDLKEIWQEQNKIYFN